MANYKAGCLILFLSTCLNAPVFVQGAVCEGTESTCNGMVDICVSGGLCTWHEKNSSCSSVEDDKMCDEVTIQVDSPSVAPTTFPTTFPTTSLSPTSPTTSSPTSATSSPTSTSATSSPTSTSPTTSSPTSTSATTSSPTSTSPSTSSPTSTSPTTSSPTSNFTSAPQTVPPVVNLANQKFACAVLLLISMVLNFLF
eukprot:CAMPEP_0196573522 /NCGR_PEP_ID=MMETSP1081-20130531/3412_1 /TAXON_ID=36882 /ORGANISM="Pyramimonas amylifera, Strain CCMP720" /LENGTH=196 /DNA_ID=CAMNT_0041891261 /DNA_START=296 /DNA_END=886 /DNA_ORIENTATION=+